MIEPLRSGRLLRDEIQIHRQDKRLRMWWLGQSGFLLQYGNRHLLLDPYLSNSLERKYEATATPHVRMTGIPIEPGQLDMIDAVTCSHAHTDHMDAETLLPLLQANPGLTIVIPEAERATLTRKLACAPPRVTGMTQGQSFELDGMRIHALISAHEDILLDEQGRSRCLGYVIEAGRWTIYHSGDAVLYPELAETLRPFHIDVALLPINGRDPERSVAGNMNAEEAIWLGRQIGARLVIPCHYEMFAFNTASVSDFLQLAAAAGVHAQALRCGEMWESASLD